MNSVIELVEKLKREKIKQTIETRMKEFESVKDKGDKEVFRELAFCILTAGTSAELGLKTIDHLGDVLFYGSEEEIREKLKQVYRFYNLRANYLHLARNAFKIINFESENVRDDLIKNIKGLGMKESSHFLRNIGYKNIAIIDFHIVDLLVRHGLIEKPKSRSLTPKKYLEIENILKQISEKTNLSLGELDLYLWFDETGKVLK